MAELERLANHLGDVGAICNDGSFSIMLAHCGVLRERVLRAAAALLRPPPDDGPHRARRRRRWTWRRTGAAVSNASSRTSPRLFPRCRSSTTTTPRCRTAPSATGTLKPGSSAVSPQAATSAAHLAAISTPAATRSTRPTRLDFAVPVLPKATSMPASGCGSGDRARACRWSSSCWTNCRLGRSTPPPNPWPAAKAWQ